MITYNHSFVGPKVAQTGGQFGPSKIQAQFSRHCRTFFGIAQAVERVPEAFEIPFSIHRGDANFVKF
jgi:hypothetical protein